MVLRDMLKRGDIKDLETQVSFRLHAKGGAFVCRYVADAVYHERDGDGWSLVVEDTKSEFTAKDPIYRLKRKWMLAEYGIEVRENIA